MRLILVSLASIALGAALGVLVSNLIYYVKGSDQ